MSLVKELADCSPPSLLMACRPKSQRVCNLDIQLSSGVYGGRPTLRVGRKLNEYGLFKGDAVIAGKTEEEIYKKLELKFYEPKDRLGRVE